MPRTAGPAILATSANSLPTVAGSAILLIVARNAETRTCYQGHPIHGHDSFCGVCGAQIDPAAEANLYDFEADSLTVVRGDRTILAEATFVVPPRSLVGVIGPSGAGKTTLLGALTGTNPADTGSVSYAGHDLYSEYELTRSLVGLVPQQDLLHPTLTVNAALDLGAQLRLPNWVSAEQRWRRISHVLSQLQIADRRTARVDRLSGGERKRTSVAMELLTAPTLLFLDEPTSGLDPGLDAKVMRLLLSLAKDRQANRTVFVVTHSVANLELCDFILVMAPGGRLAYFGPPGDCPAEFQVTNMPEVFEAIEDDPEFANARAEKTKRTQAHELRRRTQSRQKARVETPGRASAWRQWTVLVRRQLAVMGSDRRVVALLLGLPLVLGAMSAAIGTDSGLGNSVDGEPGNPYAQGILLVLLISVILLGLANTIQEIAGETVIYQRERAAGMGRTAYLLAKASVLVTVTMLQTAVVVALALLGRPGPAQPPTMGPYLSILLPLLALGGACALVGLALSALLGSRERAMNALVGAVVVLIVLSGAFVMRFDGMALDLMQRSVPSSWTYSSLAAATDIASLSPVPNPSPEWQPTVANWWEGIAATLVFWVIALVWAWLFLGRNEPRRRR